MNENRRVDAALKVEEESQDDHRFKLGANSAGGECFLSATRNSYVLFVKAVNEFEIGTSNIKVCNCLNVCLYC